MNTHVDLWDMETGNLINSWPSLVLAIRALQASVREGSVEWIEYSTLVIGIGENAPIVLAEGNDLRALVIPDESAIAAD